MYLTYNIVIKLYHKLTCLCLFCINEEVPKYFSVTFILLYLQRRQGRKYRSYSVEDLSKAYYLVREKNIAIQTAADMCGVPESTLRDRVKGKVPPTIVKSGPQPVLGLDEEGRLVDYLKLMCSFGYSFSRTDIINIATDFAIILGKREPSDALTHQWYYKFLERWPGMEVNRASSTKKQFEKATSVDCLSRYFLNLQELLTKHNLMNKPDSVFMVDEVLIDLDKTPPSIYSWKHLMKLEKYKKGLEPTMTIIASGNAAGARLPAFFIFPGKTVSSESIEDCSPGTGATCSDDGTTNCSVFQLYLENHFLKFIDRKDQDESILILYDGHRTHMSPTLVEMYKSQNVHLFPIPPSGSQCLVSVQKGIFGEMESQFDKECDAFIETELERSIHSNVCVVASRAYNEAVNQEALKAAFQRYGLHPFKPQIVNKRIDLNMPPPTPPSVKQEKMIVVTSTLKKSTRQASRRKDAKKRPPDIENMDALESQLMSNRKKKKTMLTGRLNYSNRRQSANYLAKKRAKQLEAQAPLKMKFVRDMGGKRKRGRPSKRDKEQTETDETEYETDSDYEIDEMLSSDEEEAEESHGDGSQKDSAQRTVELAIQREHFESALREELLSTHGLYFEGSQRERFEKEFAKVKDEIERQENQQEACENEEVVEEEVIDQNVVNVPVVQYQEQTDGTENQGQNVRDERVIYTEEATTSAENIETGPTVVIESVEEEIPQSEKCCVCGKYHPDIAQDGYVLEFATWGKCDYDGCDHWTHLKHCCNVKVLRRHDIFYCPCHNKV